MAGILHTINSSEVEEPKGVRDFEEELDRDYDKRLITSKYPADLVFEGQGYEVLRELYDDGLCADVDYVATDMRCETPDVVAKGKIILADIEWNLNKCQAKVSLVDDGVGARIINNIRVKVFPLADTSKNGVAITPVTEKNVEMFSDANVSLGTSKGYDWLRCMQHLVAYITDGTVDVVSDFYDALPADERYALFYGRELRTGDGSSKPPSFSFEELWNNGWKKYNLMAGVVTISGQLTLRIEEEDYWYGTVTAASFTHQDDLVESTDTNRLYASVILGSETYIKDEDNVFPYPFLILSSFTKEEFAIEGVCNTDRQLDLVSSFVIDTNSIYDALENNSKANDEKVFMIQYDHNTNQATMGQYLQPGVDPWLYNEQLLNSNVIARFNLPADAIQNIVPNDVAFGAFDTAVQLSHIFPGPFANGTTYTNGLAQVRFSNDFTAPNGFDPSNSYGNGTIQGNPVSQGNSRYTATPQGFFQFGVHIPWRVDHFLSTFDVMDGLYRLTVRFERYNSGNTLIGISQTFYENTETVSGDGSHIFNYSNDVTYGTLLFPGDYVLVDIHYDLIIEGETSFEPNHQVEMKIMDGAKFFTTFIATGGGSITADPDAYRSTMFTFERNVTLSDWVDLRGDPSQIVQIGPDGTTRIAHLYNAKRNVLTGATKWILLTNRET